MKNLLLGIALGIGAAGVLVAVVLALSDDDGTVSVPAAVPPAATSPAAPVDPSAPADPEAVPDGSIAGTATGTRQLARAYCGREQRDPDDFARDYGAGEAGMSNCIEKEIQEATRECQAELRKDPGDYVRQFGGTGDVAFERCLKYELRS